MSKPIAITLPLDVVETLVYLARTRLHDLRIYRGPDVDALRLVEQEVEQVRKMSGLDKT